MTCSTEYIPCSSDLLCAYSILHHVHRWHVGLLGHVDACNQQAKHLKCKAHFTCMGPSATASALMHSLSACAGRSAGGLRRLVRPPQDPQEPGQASGTAFAHACDANPMHCISMHDSLVLFNSIANAHCQQGSWFIAAMTVHYPGLVSCRCAAVHARCAR